MSPAATTFLTYLWHYVLARLLYDQLLRPLMQGHAAGLPALAGVATIAFVLGRSTRRRA
jgi:hypothetical protein